MTIADRLRIWNSKKYLKDNALLLGISYEAAQMFAHRHKMKYKKYPKRVCSNCGWSK